MKWGWARWLQRLVGLAKQKPTMLCSGYSPSVQAEILKYCNLAPIEIMHAVWDGCSSWDPVCRSWYELSSISMLLRSFYPHLSNSLNDADSALNWMANCYTMPYSNPMDIICSISGIGWWHGENVETKARSVAVPVPPRSLAIWWPQPREPSATAESPKYSIFFSNEIQWHLFPQGATVSTVGAPCSLKIVSS